MSRYSCTLLAAIGLLSLAPALGCDGAGGESAPSRRSPSTRVVDAGDHYVVDEDILVDKDDPVQVAWVKSMLGADEQAGTKSTFSVRQKGITKWPSGTIPYYFDANVTQAAKDAFAAAILEWEAVAKVHFVESTAADYHYKVQHNPTMTGSGNSTIGYTKGARVYYKSASPNKWTIVHELGHCLGFSHEQQSKNRDDYLVVTSTDVANNGKITDGVEYGINHDFCSIMHYGLGASIQLKDPSFDTVCTVGQRSYLSYADRLGAIKLYGDRMSTTSRCGQNAEVLRGLPMGDLELCEQLCADDRDCRSWASSKENIGLDSCVLYRNTGVSVPKSGFGTFACGIKISDLYQLPYPSNNGGYEAFLDGIRVSNVPGWTRKQAEEHCGWYYKKMKDYDPDAMVECRYQGVNMGYELFWDFQRISFEPGFSRAQAETNCLWNRATYASGTSTRLVRCRFEGQFVADGAPID